MFTHHMIQVLMDLNQLGEAMLKHNSKPRVHIKQILVLLITLGLFACKGQGNSIESLDPNYYDQSWLTGKPCAAPCWYGLEPGISIQQESIDRVEQLPFIDKSSLNITSHLDAGFIDVSFLYKRSQESGALEMIFKPDVLDSVYIYPNYRITFDQAVEKLGNPDGYWLQPDTPETHGCKLLVIWKNQRIVLWKDDGDMGWFSLLKDLCTKIGDRNGKLPENMVIETAQIDSPDGIKSLTNGTAFNPWEGFAK
jgi:hypothetical protein